MSKRTINVRVRMNISVLKVTQCTSFDHVFYMVNVRGKCYSAPFGSSRWLLDKKQTKYRRIFKAKNLGQTHQHNRVIH